MTDINPEALAKQLWSDATPEQLAATIEEAKADAKKFGGGIFGLPESVVISHLEAAHAKIMAKAKAAGTSDYTDAEIDFIRDVKNTYTKKALRQRKAPDGSPLAPNPGTLRTNFIKKWGLEKHEEAMRITGATTDLRVAGKNPWKGNKAVKRALKGTEQDTPFNRIFAADRIATPPKVKLTPEQKGSNPFFAANWSLTKQSALYKLSPDLATSMATRAGVRIGSTKPVM
jgi:hypothetical protein